MQSLHGHELHSGPGNGYPQGALGAIYSTMPRDLPPAHHRALPGMVPALPFPHASQPASAAPQLPTLAPHGLYGHRPSTSGPLLPCGTWNMGGGAALGGVPGIPGGYPPMRPPAMGAPRQGMALTGGGGTYTFQANRPGALAGAPHLGAPQPGASQASAAVGSMAAGAGWRMGPAPATRTAPAPWAAEPAEATAWKPSEATTPVQAERGLEDGEEQTVALPSSAPDATAPALKLLAATVSEAAAPGSEETAGPLDATAQPLVQAAAAARRRKPSKRSPPGGSSREGSPAADAGAGGGSAGEASASDGGTARPGEADAVPAKRQRKPRVPYDTNEFIQGHVFDSVVLGEELADKPHSASNVRLTRPTGSEEEGQEAGSGAAAAHGARDVVETGGAANRVQAEELEEEDDSLCKVVSAVPVDTHHVEVVVEVQGRRYHGVMERSVMPTGVGVAIQAVPEELENFSDKKKDKGVNPMNVCSLCNIPLKDQPVQGMESAARGFLAKVQVTCNWVARCHLVCALWCPEISEVDAFPGHYYELGNAVRRGRALRCVVCKERGATIGCFAEGCSRVYHLNCAQASDCLLVEETRQCWCPRHRRDRGKPLSDTDG